MRVCAKWLLVSNGGAAVGTTASPWLGSHIVGLLPQLTPCIVQVLLFPVWVGPNQNRNCWRSTLYWKWIGKLPLHLRENQYSRMSCFLCLVRAFHRKRKILLNLPHNLNILVSTVRFVAALKDVAPCSLHQGHRGRWWVGYVGSCLLAKGRSGHPGHHWLGTGFFHVNCQHLWIQDKSQFQVVWKYFNITMLKD